MPPAEDDYLWVFLSHLGATYTSLSSADALKSFLRLYDWSQSEGRRRRIEAISQVESQPVEEIVQGSAVRGIEFKVSLTEAEFQDVGDLHLFGEVLKEFLAHYVTVNSFLRLTLVLKPSGALLQWDTFKGKRWPI
jgi:type VI secretion system protein ImpG